MKKLLVMYVIGVNAFIVASFYQSFWVSLSAYCLTAAVLSVVVFGLMKVVDEVMDA